MSDKYNKKGTCPICGIQRLGNNPYCPNCGFSYSSLKKIRVSDILSDESGMCDACAPTGFTECDCCTCSQTPRHLRPKPKPVPVTQPRQKTKPVQREEPRKEKQPRQNVSVESVQEEYRQEKKTESHNACCSVCVGAPFRCIGSLIKGVYGLLKFLLILGLGFAFIYFFFFWLQHQ